MLGSFEEKVTAVQQEAEDKVAALPANAREGVRVSVMVLRGRIDRIQFTKLQSGNALRGKGDVESP